MLTSRDDTGQTHAGGAQRFQFSCTSEPSSLALLGSQSPQAIMSQNQNMLSVYMCTAELKGRLLSHLRLMCHFQSTEDALPFRLSAQNLFWCLPLLAGLYYLKCPDMPSRSMPLPLRSESDVAARSDNCAADNACKRVLWVSIQVLTWSLSQVTV